MSIIIHSEGSPMVTLLRRSVIRLSPRKHTPPPHPSMALFDAPDGGATCTRRHRSTTPLQALGRDLVLLMDPLEALPIDLVQALLTSLREQLIDDLRDASQAGAIVHHVNITAFADLDLTDTHTVSVTPGGTLTVAVFTRFPVALALASPVSVYVMLPPTGMFTVSLMLPLPLAVNDVPAVPAAVEHPATH